jgi:type I restriction enzyme S subunit
MAIGLLKEMPVEVPPLEVQRRIADTLMTYDALIANNLRRIRILEEMSSGLYREWFVDFRFPGYNDAVVTSEHRGAPNGWTVGKLSDVADVNRTQLNVKTPPERILYIDISSVSTGTIKQVSSLVFADAPGRARRIVKHGDILWSCVRPNRRSHVLVLDPEADTVASTGFAVLTAKKVPYTFLYYATTTDAFVAYLTNHATGAAYPAVTAETFEDADLLLPPSALLERFAKIGGPQAELIAVLQRQNVNLRETRDLLLPRLLSGQLRLADKEADQILAGQSMSLQTL